MPSSEVLHKFKEGTLRSGGGGKKVKSKSQALAIMFSERANELAHGGKYKEGKKK